VRAPIVLAALSAVAATAAPVHAEPVFGTAISYGEALGTEAEGRVSTTLYGYAPLPGGWTLGGELAGSFEAYEGGYGCRDHAPGAIVPSVAVTCVQPGVAAHALFGTRAAPTASTRLHLEVGAGAASLYLMPGGGGDTTRTTYASGLVRASYLARIGRAFTGEWWLGLQLEERALGLEDSRLSRSIGLVLEGSSF